MISSTVLIKPVSSLCNCDCKYCFYHDVANSRVVSDYGMISENVWKKIIVDALLCVDYQEVTFSFQGGEPLLAKPQFYRDFISYVNEINTDKKVGFTVQTNGVLIDEEYCMIFKQYDFLVGVSLDGFRENHDFFRFIANDGSFSRVISSINRLREYNIRFNIMTVLTNRLALYPKELYNFYKENEYEYIQIIPCIDNLNDRESSFALTPDLYEPFFLELFRLWLDDFLNGKYISINIFDDIISLLLGRPPVQCGALGQCQLQCVVESNGDVYPCDFYAIDSFRLGNVLADNMVEISSNTKSSLFRNYENQTPTILCKECMFSYICHGNCKRIRKVFLNDNFCGYKSLIKAIYENIPEIISAINNT